MLKNFRKRLLKKKSNRVCNTRTERSLRRLGLESLESRRVLAGWISEVHVSPLFGSNDTDQYVELRGAPNAVIPNGSYFTLVEGWGAVPGGTGYIHSVIDLSGLSFGSNGFLVFTQSGNPYSVAPESTHVTSNLPGFAGLTGGRWSDASTLSDRLAFIYNSGTFMLIEAPQAPVPGADADANDDGFFDGAAANWNIVDSVGLLNSTAGPSRSYGRITFSEDASYFHPAATELIKTDGGGYVGRIGASTQWRANDWVSGTTIDDSNVSGKNYRFTFGTFGDPRPLVYAGRELNHLGNYNFNGGVQGLIVNDIDGDGVPTPGDGGIPDVRVIADTNKNGTRDNETVSVIPSDYLDGTELTNSFHNATLTVADGNNDNIGFVVRPRTIGHTSTNRPINVFASEGIPWYDTGSRLKVLFYQEANSVSIDSLAAEVLRDSYGRMEVYDRNDVMLEFVQTGPMRGTDRQTLTINRPTADIKYAIIYTNDAQSSSSPFGAFDNLHYSFPEFYATSDAQGRYFIEGLHKADYDIYFENAPNGKLPWSSGNGIYSLSVTKFEHVLNGHFGFRNNLPPDVEASQFFVPENSTIGTVIARVIASDPDPDQSITFQFVSDSGPFAINASTGDIRIANNTPWDFETSQPLQIQVKVTDNYSVPEFTIKTITLTPTDVNEPPKVQFAEFTIPENSLGGTTVGTVTATDPDSVSHGPFHYFIGDNTLANYFAIDESTGVLKILAGAPLDFETKPTWSVPIKVTDESNPPMSSTSPVSVRLTDVNDGPRDILFANVFNVPESTNASTAIAVATVQIVDDSFGTNSLSLSGPDAAFFSLSNGQLKFQNAQQLDFETKSTFTVTVNADDSTVGTTPDVSKEFQLKIVDVNEPPTGVVLVNVPSGIPESTSTASGLKVATITLVDDALGVNSLSLAGPDASKFALSGNELRFKPNTVLNFESQSNFVVSVAVDDASVGSTPDASTTLTVTIVDVNEPPTSIQISPVVSEVQESTSPTAGFVVADLVAIDDALGTVNFQLSGADVAAFEVVGSQLKFKSGVVVDFETKSQYDVTVTATDPGLPGAAFPSANARVTVRNAAEVLSVTDKSGKPLTSSIKSLRLTWDSAVTLATGAVRVLKTDIGNVPIVPTFTTSLVNGKTVADLAFTGPFSNGDWLTDGNYVVEVDGTKVQETSTQQAGSNFTSSSFSVVSAAMPATLTLTSVDSTRINVPIRVNAKVVGNPPVSGSVDYKLDVDGDGTVDRTVTGTANFDLTDIQFSSAGSFTMIVTAEKFGVMLAKSSLVIDVSPTNSSSENWLSALDADRDNSISPLDALIIINRLNSRSGSDPVPYNLYEDVDRDGSISPLDVLALVNYLNADPNSRTSAFSSVSLTEAGGVRGLTNDVSVRGQISGSSRSLFVSLDGTIKKDASSFVKPDGSFEIQDAAIAQLFGGVADGDHVLSLVTKNASDFSTAVDKRFTKVARPLNEFQVTSVLPINGQTRIQWSASNSGARYKVYASQNRASPVLLAGSLSVNEASISLAAGAYDLFVEAYDGAGNIKRTSTLRITV